MTDDQANQGGWRSAARGEATWKAAIEAVAARNAAARKAAKQHREAYDRRREQARRAADR